ncbi:hypothetical protein FKW77_003459 [Venturia effusa]|uniref:F-box domain-containing protein n=1 Tax=Venturia effusa TaxID=50376 RepID=A0A517KW03_9PEZI|nr:hypothetical protein FKW77_003459 [Venturia effusa]
MAEPSFLGIPQELRDQIYGYLLPSGKSLCTRQSRIHDALSSKDDLISDPTRTLRSTLVEPSTLSIETKAVYADKKMKQALAAYCSTNIYGVSRQICSEAQDALIRANEFRLVPADLTTPMRQTLPRIPVVPSNYWWIRTVEEFYDVMAFMVETCNRNRTMILGIIIAWKPAEFVKLELTTVRLLLAPLFDNQCEVPLFFPSLHILGMEDWSAHTGNSLLVEQCLDNLEGLHTLLLELAVYTRGTIRGIDGLLRSWAEKYRKLQGSALDDWVKSKLEGLSHSCKKEVEESRKP